MTQQPPQTPKPKRVLVVDDDAVLRRRISRILQSAGFVVDVASDGVEGLEVCHEVRPDLIVTDVEMPQMDGWELVRRLRTDPRTSMVPVVFLTARGAAQDVLRGFRLGADDFLNKPVSPPELLDRVREVARRRAEMHRRYRRPRGPRPGLEGRLEELGLSTLLTILQETRRTGLIRVWRIHRGEREAGRIWVRAGSVMRARVDGRLGSENEDAIYYLLTWERGGFSFVSTEAASAPSGESHHLPDPIRSSTQQLLLEGARRIDEIVRDEPEATNAIRRAFCKPTDAPDDPTAPEDQAEAA